LEDTGRAPPPHSPCARKKHLLELVRRVRVAVLRENGGEGGSVGVHGVEPGVEGAGVQRPGQVPGLVAHEVLGEEQEQLRRRAVPDGNECVYV
jgi:hypothetical protein